MAVTKVQSKAGGYSADMDGAELAEVDFLDRVRVSLSHAEVQSQVSSVGLQDLGVRPVVGAPIGRTHVPTETGHGVVHGVGLGLVHLSRKARVSCTDEPGHDPNVVPHVKGA